MREWKRTGEYAMASNIAVAHILSAIETAPNGAVSLREVARDRVSTSHFDMKRIQRHEGVSQSDAPYVWLRLAAEQIKNYLDIEDSETDSIVRIKKGKDAGAVRLDGVIVNLEPPTEKYRNAFFDKNQASVIADIQKDRVKDIGDLVESMRAIGWLPSSVVIKDARTGFILSGNRRMAAVERLRAEGVEITPIIKDLHLDMDDANTLVAEDGDEYDKLRFREWLFSNIGRKEFTPTQRKMVTEYLAAKKWSIAEIASAMEVPERTVREDTMKLRAKQRKQRDEKIAYLAKQGWSQRQIAELLGIPKTTVVRVVQNGKSAKSDHPPTPPSEGTQRRKVYDKIIESDEGVSNKQIEQLGRNAPRTARKLAEKGLVKSVKVETGETVYAPIDAEIKGEPVKRSTTPAPAVKPVNLDPQNEVRELLSKAFAALAALPANDQNILRAEMCQKCPNR